MGLTLYLIIVIKTDLSKFSVEDIGLGFVWKKEYWLVVLSLFFFIYLTIKNYVFALLSVSVKPT